ncbi:MAG: glycosyltransferase, partial [Halioglobus sp.]|nr:glycosyltransferase [Halioglobus sp.]
LQQAGLDYELALLGQRFRAVPAPLQAVMSDHAGSIVHAGFLPSRAEYFGVLHAADVVLSTALHEFQGLSVLEAVQAGCVPVVPDRLAYREMYPARFRYRSLPDNAPGEADAAASCILELAGVTRMPEPPDVSAYGAAQLAPAYRRMLHRVHAGRHSQ